MALMPANRLFQPFSAGFYLPAEHQTPDYGRYDERLLRGVATAKGLSCRRGLRCRRGIPDPNGFRGFSGMGVAELEFAARGCAFINRISDRGYTRLGIRHHTARD